MDDTKTLKSIDKKLSALIALQALSIFGTSTEKSQAKPEAILSDAGLESAEIALLLGKNAGAVRKAIQRAKK